MSSPATSCSRRYTDSASTYCSRNRLITIASRNDFNPRFSVYQLGRGNDPVIVVASSLPAVALIMMSVLRCANLAAATDRTLSGQVAAPTPCEASDCNEKAGSSIQEHQPP